MFRKTEASQNRRFLFQSSVAKFSQSKSFPGYLSSFPQSIVDSPINSTFSAVKAHESFELPTKSRNLFHFKENNQERNLKEIGTFGKLETTKRYLSV